MSPWQQLSRASETYPFLSLFALFQGWWPACRRPRPPARRSCCFRSCSRRATRAGWTAQRECASLPESWGAARCPSFAWRAPSPYFLFRWDGFASVAATRFQSTNWMNLNASFGFNKQTGAHLSKSEYISEICFKMSSLFQALNSESKISFRTKFEY